MSYLIDNELRKILIWIPARGGSKGVPRKALRMIGDKPLIAYTIESALNTGTADKVIVNTDDIEIREVALSYGAEVPFLRPKELATDSASLHDVFIHQSEWLRTHQRFTPEINIGMSPTHPFRRNKMIDNALEMARTDSSIYNIRSVAILQNRIDNCWVKKRGGYKPFFSKNDRFLNIESLYQNKFSFNLVVDCRNPSGITPFLINDIEAIDVDEIHDLEIARGVVAKGW